MASFFSKNGPPRRGEVERIVIGGRRLSKGVMRKIPGKKGNAGRGCLVSGIRLGGGFSRKKVGFSLGGRLNQEGR